MEWLEYRPTVPAINTSLKVKGLCYGKVRSTVVYTQIPAWAITTAKKKNKKKGKGSGNIQYLNLYPL